MVQKRLANLYGGTPQKVIRYRWVEWESISPDMRLAVIAAEDQTFPQHWGFDFEAIEKALRHNEKSRRLRGGS